MGFVTGVMCDKCRAVEYSDREKTMPTWLLTSKARRRGWTVGKKVLCPKCKRGARKDV